MEGATMARVFKIYVERVLAPSLWSGQIVVMDNLSAHGPARVGELIEKRVASCPICRSARPTTSRQQRRSSRPRTCSVAAARIRGILVEAMGAAPTAVTAADARGFFEHADYRRADQPL
ncbi:MAG: hypothetical protein AVDCRST_MAG93-4253 [uncultured Chloroflexia bacterium]|uniref:Tc1-like transposase DDE domain-containing protein n=1 Tax=uncultured Chloroflexia bacterium TaxID=1672391 RepID=A0A6J4K581_9CHLR|nr:MAG: hypothetical protein AVDCRST_MAG93-4253 [uncultured Chloroflexia bacterium]